MTLHVRAAILRPSTLDIEARTIEAIASTGADAPRPGFVESLDLRGANLSKLIGGPVLDGHRRETTQDQLGVIEAAQMTLEGLLVLIRFRQTDAALAVMRDVADGTLRGLSIGYTVEKWADTQDGKTRRRTATSWTPVEVSVVPVPADAGAHFRNGDMNMPTQDDSAQVQTRAQVNTEIRNIATLAGMTRAWTDAQIDAEATPEVAREAAFAEMARAQANTRTRTATAEITIDHTDPAVIATRAGEALFGRSHPEHQISEPARAFAHMSFVDIGRDCLRRSGVSVQSISADTIITRALHTTSDFPLILGDAVNRELRMAYEAAPSGARLLSRQTTARDFRAKRKIMLGEAPTLEVVREGGEFKSGTIEEAQQTYGMETCGTIMNFARQLLVNDDMGAFTAMPKLFGIAARAFENDQLVAKITANPAMSDGVAVFNAAHGNVAAAANIDVTSLAAARLGMRKQTGLSGMLIDVTPRFVMVPPELETLAEQQLTQLQATQSDNVNPFAKLTLVVEPRLTSATQWYVIADPALVDGLEYAYLEGAPGPQIETRAGFEVDGVQIKVRLDFGCGWIDHRGWFRVG